MVGDGAETAALILDQLPVDAGGAADASPTWVEDARAAAARRGRPSAQRTDVLGWVRGSTRWERFTLLQAAHRRAARRRLTDARRARAGQAAALPATTMAARLTGEWTPTAGVVRRRCVAPTAPTPTARGRIRLRWPSPLDRRCRAGAPSSAARTGGRLAGRVEVGRHPRPGRRAATAASHLWSRGEELITDRFPEVRDAAQRAARRHGARRRGAGVPRRPAAAVLGPAAADRPARQRGAHGARRAGGVHGLRRARTRRAATCGTGRSTSAARSLEALVAAAARPRPSRPRRPRAALLPFDDGPPPADSPAVLQLSPRRRCRHRVVGRRWRSCAIELARPRRRRADAQAADVALRRRAQARRLVEVEDRAAHDRRRADLRPAGIGQARQPAHRLHLRRLGRRRAGAGGQGLLRA